MAWLDEVPAAFRPFFAERPRAHLSMLNALPLGVLNGLVTAIRSSADAESSLLALLEKDWRKELVGAVGALVTPSPRLVAAIWAAFDRGSWVSPQLAAVLRRIDPDFMERARRGIDEWPSTSRDPKGLSALMALGRQLPAPRESWPAGEVDAERSALLDLDRARGDLRSVRYFEEIAAALPRI